MFDDAKRWETYSSVLSLKDISLAYSPVAATASYDLATQQVILPMWDCLDDASTQALASHEIGHAKFSDYTLDSFNDFFSRYKDLFNVVEDARIERLMKKEFAGLNSIFKDGYSVLARNNIFPLAGIETAPLVERLNVFAKFGFMVEVPFNTKEESEFAYRILNLSTKADVVDLCEDIFQYLKKVHEDQKESQQDSKKGNGEKSSEKANASFAEDNEEDAKADSDGDDNDSDSSSEDDGMEASEEQKNAAQGEDREEDEDSDGGFESELNDSRTRDFQKTIEDRFKKYANAQDKPIILDSKSILSRNYAELDKKGVALYRESARRTPNGRRQLREIVERCAMEAASLFAQKKSAIDNFAKKRMHFGKIDTKKLAKHSISDAIFKTVEKLPKGKNHGVVLLLDFSISMSTYSSADVQKCACLQAAILGRFCQIVGIPFSIVLFGCEMGTGCSWHRTASKRIVKIADSSFFDIDFILTLGDLKKKGHVVVSDTEGSQYILGLGCSTPTLEAMVVARKEVLAMRARGVEKAAIIVATDGGYTDRVYINDGYVDVDKMKRLLLDAKPFDISDLQGYDRNRMRLVDDWGFELFAGYVRKETGASIIFSSIAAEHDMISLYRVWKQIDEYEQYSSIYRTGIEPYVFKHAWLKNVSIADINKNEVLRESFLSFKLDGKGVIDQYLVMNASKMKFDEAKQRDFDGLDDVGIASKLCSHSKGLKAYKAFAKAFVDFFS